MYAKLLYYEYVVGFFSQQMIFLHSFDIFRCEYRTQMYLPDRNSVVEKMPRKTQIIQKYLTVIFEWCYSGLFLHICSIFYLSIMKNITECWNVNFVLISEVRSVCYLPRDLLSEWLISEFVTFSKLYTSSLFKKISSSTPSTKMVT